MEMYKVEHDVHLQHIFLIDYKCFIYRRIKANEHWLNN